MIDTVKICAEINQELYNKINSLSIIKTSYNKADGEIFYEIINDHLEGSYDSKLSVRVGCGSKYRFNNLGYYVEIEGSYHKIVRGYNSHNGYYDLNFVCSSLINFVELSYDVKLPSLENWYLQRCDIAICFDLKNQDNVKSYINSLSRCNYPRRKVKFFYDESIYVSGTSTTLKIYNKLLEFRFHDLKKFLGTNFNVEDYCNTISGFVRFECEIKKKRLQQLLNTTDRVKVIDINYYFLKDIWSDEFMKLLKFVKNDLNIVRGREDVYNRLISLFKPCVANRLYSFYCNIQLNGIDDVKSHTSESTYFRYINELENAKVDFSQSYKVQEHSIYYFNPFEAKEVV